MSGPVLIYADNAEVLAAGLRARCPGETVHAVDQPEAGQAPKAETGLCPNVNKERAPASGARSRAFSVLMESVWTLYLFGFTQFPSRQMNPFGSKLLMRFHEGRCSRGYFAITNV